MVLVLRHIKENSSISSFNVYISLSGFKRLLVPVKGTFLNDTSITGDPIPISNLSMNLAVLIIALDRPNFV